jgi:homoserine kinase
MNLIQATVTIPATSANLGPGFDCLGLALNLYQTVTFTTKAAPGLTITACGEDAGKIPTDESNLVWQSADLLFQRVGQRPSTPRSPGLHIHQENHIPIGSGLGSSSSAVLAGLLGANAVLGEPFSRAEILQQATDLEGHPDNVAPAVHGGLVLGVQALGGLVVERIAVPPLRVVVVLPDFHLLTAQARAALPVQVSLQDAIFNASRLGLLIRGLEAGDYDKIGLAMQDRLHQPYRIPLIPGLAAAFAAAYTAGAAGVAISGAGPSLIAFAPDRHEAIGAAVTAVFAHHHLTTRTWILEVDRQGCRVEVKKIED